MIPILIILVCIQISTIRGDCDYTRYVRGGALVLHRIRDDYLISTKQRNYNIPEDGSIELFCGSDFEPYSYNRDSDKQSSFGNMMTLYCDNGVTHFNMGNYKRKRFSDNKIFTCPLFSPSFYAQNFDYCEYEGFYYGMEINQTPTVLAEFCYNYNNSEIISVHYVAGKRNTFLSAQREYNPSESERFIFNDASKIRPLNEEYPPRIKLENNFTLFNPSQRLLLPEIHYEFHELVPSHLYSGHFHDFIRDMKSTNAITWWMPLKNGNWKIFQRLLAKETIKRNFEIYAGQSDVVWYPRDFVCNSINELTYEFNEEQKNVPLYIWNYIIPRNNDHDNKAKEEFVLVAINSPFTETITNNSLALCDDMCDQIDWLRQLESTRRMASFGYIFCCKPDDVKNKLTGFPKL